MMPHQRLALRHALPALAAAALLAGCASAPPYTPPVPAQPAQFKEAGYWREARPQAAAVPDAWWTLFGDPVLDGLQARVVVDNENLKASVAQMRQAQAALAASRAPLFPTLNAGLAASRSSSNTANTPGTLYTLSGSASWEVDLWGRLSGAVDGATARLDASRDDLLAARLSTQATLAQSYFSLRAAEVQTEVLARTVQAYQRSLELTQHRYEAGVASAADVAQALSQLKSAQAQQIEVRTQRAQLEHALAVLLGQPPAAFSLPPVTALPQAPQVPPLLPATLLERRPDIAAAERRMAAANAQIGVARAAFFPALTLSANAAYRGRELNDLVRSPNLLWSLGPSLLLAVFDGGARQAATDQARAALDQAAASYRQTVLTALQEVEDNLVAAANLREEVQVQAEALAAAQRALEIALNQYRAGTVSYLNVVSAQTTVLSAERSMVDLRNRELAATSQLLKNIAGRWDVPLDGAAASASGF